MHPALISFFSVRVGFIFSLNVVFVPLVLYLV